MSAIHRLGGYSVQCDTCREGGFVGTYNLDTALLRMGLMKNGWDEQGEDTHKCANGCNRRGSDGWLEFVGDGG